MADIANPFLGRAHKRYIGDARLVNCRISTTDPDYQLIADRACEFRFVTVKESYLML